MTDASGHFGRFGGIYVPETLIPALKELSQFWQELRQDASFWDELHQLLQDYVGRPTPLYFAPNLSRQLGGRIYLKREDLCHTGAHKINNALGQGLLAKRLGKKRLIAETGAGQHGVAVATVASLLGFECEIFMGAQDMKRQAANVQRMEILGAKVISVTLGSQTLKDAMNEALRDWVSSIRTTHYLIGSVAGPHPYPSLVRDFQAIIGMEVRKQILQKENALPQYLVACVGGGSNAMGLFKAFLKEPSIHLIGVEAAGEGLASDRHAASLTCGSEGILHGSRSFLLQDEHGQVQPTHSISAGLDYPGVGPQLADLKDRGRLRVATVSDKEAILGFELLARTEGIIPALESSHALGFLLSFAREMKKEDLLVLNLSGRGDKDLNSYRQWGKK